MSDFFSRALAWFYEGGIAKFRNVGAPINKGALTSLHPSSHGLHSGLHASIHSMDQYSRQPLRDNHTDEELADDAPVYDLYDDGTDIHLATVEEKKRLWWKNAFINALFIASWYVRRRIQRLSVSTRYTRF